MALPHSTATNSNQLSISGINGQTLGYSGSAVSNNANVAANGVNFVSGISGLTDGTGLASNYALPALSAASLNNAVTINKAALTLTATGNTKTYDGTTASSGNVAISGLVGGQNLASPLAETYASVNAGTGITLTTNLAGLAVMSGNNNETANYTITAVNGKGTITPASVTAIYSVANKVYDGSTAAFGSTTLAGVLGNDNLSLQVGTAGRFANKNVGSAKPLSESNLSLSGSAAGNYILTSSTASTTAAITPASATVNATALSTTYNGSIQTQSGTMSGFLTGDNIVLNGLASARNAGTYQSALSISGSDAGNYTVLVNNAPLVMNKAVIAIGALNSSGPDLLASAHSKIYDGTTSASGALTLQGLYGNDVLSASANKLNFTTPSPGNGLAVDFSGITLSGNPTTLANYTLAQGSVLALADIKTLLAPTLSTSLNELEQPVKIGQPYPKLNIICLGAPNVMTSTTGPTTVAANGNSTGSNFRVDRKVTGVTCVW